MALLLFHADKLDPIADQPEKGFRSVKAAQTWAKNNVKPSIENRDGSMDTPMMVALSVPLKPFRFRTAAPTIIDVEEIGVVVEDDTSEENTQSDPTSGEETEETEELQEETEELQEDDHSLSEPTPPVEVETETTYSDDTWGTE